MMLTGIKYNQSGKVAIATLRDGAGYKTTIETPEHDSEKTARAAIEKKLNEYDLGDDFANRLVNYAQ
jgi:hypothetical protein